MSIVTFKYTALDGAGKQHRGTIRAGDEQEAYRKVSVSGLTPLTLEQMRESRPLFRLGRVTTNDVVNLTRELAVLVEARIPLDRGLLSIAEHETKPQLAAMIRTIATDIESGQPMTKALERHRAVFGDVYIETIRAAEASGSMQAVMSHLAEMLERQSETRQQVRRALSYPIIVMSVVGVAVSIIVGFVVPKFARTFSGAGVELPLATRIIQQVGFSVQSYWWAYLGVIASVIISLFIAWRRPAGRCKLEEWIARIPYISRIIMSVTTARFARVMGIALTSGLDVTDSLQVAGRSTGRPVFVRECNDMARRLRSGERLPDVLRSTRSLPSFAKRMVSAGKDSREMARACDIVARHYDREAGHLTRNISTVVEPLLTVAMAGIVLLVALSVFLPMWQMVRLKR